MKKITHKIGDIVYYFFIGQNAKENWNLIDNSKPDDMWFHLDDFPSTHVVVSQDSTLHSEIYYPNQIIALGSNYCKSHSKKKNELKIKIVYTHIKNITKGKEVGSVFTSNEKYFII